MTAIDRRVATVPQKSVGLGSSLPRVGPYAADGWLGWVTRSPSVEGIWAARGQAQPRPKTRPESAPPASTVVPETVIAAARASAAVSPLVTRASSVGVIAMSPFRVRGV